MRSLQPLQFSSKLPQLLHALILGLIEGLRIYYPDIEPRLHLVIETNQDSDKASRSFRALFIQLRYQRSLTGLVGLISRLRERVHDAEDEQISGSAWEYDAQLIVTSFPIDRIIKHQPFQLEEHRDVLAHFSKSFDLFVQFFLLFG